MGQLVMSWFICDGRVRVHAINAVGRRSARIIEIENVDTGQRFHGNARMLQRLFHALGSSGVGEPLTLSIFRCRRLGPACYDCGAIFADGALSPVDYKELLERQRRVPTN